MRNTISFFSIIICVLALVGTAPHRAYAAGCSAGGTFLCNVCGTPHFTGFTSPAPANARITWWDFDNRPANRGALGSVEFGQNFCGTNAGDPCVASLGGTNWIVEGGDWTNALDCTVSGGGIPNTSILVENFTTTGLYAFINARDNATPNAQMDVLINAGTSVLTSNPIPSVATVTFGSVNGGSCSDGSCMDVTFALTDFSATTATAKDGGNVLTAATGGWVVYRRLTAPATEGARVGWVVAGTTAAAPTPATQNIAAGPTITVRVDNLDHFFALAPVFGGGGVGCRAMGVAADTVDITCAGQETIYLSPSIRVNPGAAFGLSAKANYSNPQTVNLEWKTVFEGNTAGFNIYRAPVQGGLFKKINTSLIPAQGAGTTYTRVDTINQTTYTKYSYKFEMVDAGGTPQTSIVVETKQPISK